MNEDTGEKLANPTVALAGGLAVILILVLGTLWTVSTASRDTQEAARSVSLLYLDELAGRREQVVANNLKDDIERVRVAVMMIGEDDLSSEEALGAYQARMKQLYGLENLPSSTPKGRYTPHPMAVRRDCLKNTASIRKRYRSPRYMRAT